MIPFAAYEPDRSRHAPDASDAIINAKPVKDGWAPLKSLEPITTALADEPRAGYTMVSPAKSIYTVVGTSAALYRLNSDLTWSDVTGTAYSLPLLTSWTFVDYGSRLLAAQGGDPIQYLDIDSDPTGTFADLPNAPTAKYVAIVGDFVVAAHLSTDPSGLAWSGLNNSEQWTAGENLSDVQTFADGGEITGIVPVSTGAIIFQTKAIRLMSFNPSSGFVFTFSLLTGKRGCQAPRSIVKLGEQDFMFLADDGWYRGIDGAIGAERIDETFVSQIDAPSLKEVESVADPFQNIVWIRCRALDGFKIYGYHWKLDRWFQSDQSTTGFGVFSRASVTVEDLGTLYPDGIDSIPISLDDQFLGGRPAFAGFDSNYKLGFFTGPNQAAILETATGELNAPNRAFLRGAQVMDDLGVQEEINGVLQATFTMQIGTANYHSQDLSWGDEIEPSVKTGIVPIRSAARLHRARVNIKAGATWDTCKGVRPDVVAEGNQ